MRSLVATSPRARTGSRYSIAGVIQVSWTKTFDALATSLAPVERSAPLGDIGWRESELKGEHRKPGTPILNNRLASEKGAAHALKDGFGDVCLV